MQNEDEKEKRHETKSLCLFSERIELGRNNGARVHALQGSLPPLATRSRAVARNQTHRHRCTVTGRATQHRGVSFNIGDRVRVGESEGYVADRNDSANFQVQFFRGPYAGGLLSVHPAEIEVIL
jgi:hypothetical protein